MSDLADRAVHAWAWRTVTNATGRTDISVDDVRYEYSSYMWDDGRTEIVISYHTTSDGASLVDTSAGTFWTTRGWHTLKLSETNPVDLIKECLGIYEELRAAE